MIDTSKVIHAPVGGGRYTVTAPIVKEDYGLYLKIEGLELPTTYEVDFSNSEHNGTSVTMIGNADGVLIPRQFITTGKDVFAFLYHVGADFGRTVYKFRIPNKLRPDRTNEEPTPEQQSVIDQAISALNSAVAQTAQDKADADVSAQNASADAERAEEARTDAQNYATQAEQSATSASQSASQASASATASAQSASQSAQIKSDVEGMVDDAQASATASAQSATASANSASQASGYAQSASASASSAQGYASQAQTSAQTASAKASEASTSASTASTKASEASASATNAQDYANTAESAKTYAQTAQGLTESARDSAISAKEDAEDARDEAQSIVDGISEKVEQIDSNTERIESLEDDRYKPYAMDSASGAIASFVDGADDIPLKSLVVNIDPVQDLHGYDSPWVGGGGKNKLFLTATTTTINGVTFTVNDDGTIVVNGTATADIVFEIWSKAQNGGNVLLPSGQYIVNGGANGGGTSTYRVGSNGFAWSGGTLKTETDSLTFTITENEVQTNIWIQVFNGTSLSNVVFKPMIRLASVTDASFAPYENICPISGWTGMQLQKTGVNIWNGTLGNDVFVPFPTKVGVQYSVSAKMVDSTQNTYLYVRKRTVGDTSTGTIFKYIITGKTVTPQAFTAEAGYEYGLWSNAKYTNVTDVQIKVGSSATAYEPYNGTSIPISWQTEAGTVYGGKLDVLSGVMTVEMAGIQIKDVSWTTPSTNVFRTELDKKTETLTIPMSDAYKSVNPVSAVANLPNGSITVHQYWNATNYRKIVYIKDIRYTTVEEFVEAMGEHQIVYALNTPITIQLTSHEVNSLLGTNNIFADTGDCSVEYRADTKLYIERLTAPDSADMIADANIVSGQYFMVGNTLYKATANIANGSAIIVGTNCIRKSLSEALNEINA